MSISFLTTPLFLFQVRGVATSAFNLAIQNKARLGRTDTVISELGQNLSSLQEQVLNHGHAIIAHTYLNRYSSWISNLERCIGLQLAR